MGSLFRKKSAIGSASSHRIRCVAIDSEVRLRLTPSQIAKHVGSVAVPPEVEGWSAEQLRTAIEKGVAEDVRREDA